MAAVVANKVKRNRSARHSNKQGGAGGGGFQFELDAHGKLRQVGGGVEEEIAAKKREAAKRRPNAGYYRKVRAGERKECCTMRARPRSSPRRTMFALRLPKVAFCLHS